MNLSKGFPLLVEISAYEFRDGDREEICHTILDFSDALGRMIGNSDLRRFVRMAPEIHFLYC